MIKPRRRRGAEIFVALLIVSSLASQEPKLKERDASKAKEAKVTAPKAVYTPEPKKPKGKHPKGVVVLWLIVGKGGLVDPATIKVGRSLDPEWDKAAIAAVTGWRFEPATKNGSPVAVQISVEVHCE
jgi:TonB family protein